MLIKELVAEIHQNAVAHGWWDSERSIEEIDALIHSEWSEALEEARMGHPLVYRVCLEDPEEESICQPKDASDCMMYGKETRCKYYGKKPEGIAVELIDGCIRILDYFGKVGLIAKDAETGNDLNIEEEYNDPAVTDLLPRDAVILIANLHTATSYALDQENDREYFFLTALSLAMSWIKANGIDPLALLMEKHEYNKTRPYKHGKQF